MTTVAHNCRPRGHFAPRTTVTDVATMANSANGSDSLSIGGMELADESGNRSDRIAPKANRKQSRTSAANAALPPLVRFGPFAVTHSMRTHRREYRVDASEPPVPVPQPQMLLRSSSPVPPCRLYKAGTGRPHGARSH